MNKNIQNRSFNYLTFFILIGLIVLLGCSSRPDASARYQKNFNFTNVESYSIYERNSEFTDFQNISDATRNGIELAIEQVLDAQGLGYQTVDKADVVVGYHLINNHKELRNYNRSVKFCRPCLSAGDAKKDKKAWRMLPGSLVLDLVSRDKNRTIWRSVYPLKIKPDDNSFEIQDKIFEAIDNMVKTLPREVVNG